MIEDADLFGDTNFKKFDGGKTRLELLPVEGLEWIGRAVTYGAAKYEDENWRKCTDPGRYVGALLRHLFAWKRGERLDPESRLPHLAHAGANILFLLTLEHQGELPEVQR